MKLKIDTYASSVSGFLEGGNKWWTDQQFKNWTTPWYDMAFRKHCLALYRERDRLLAQGRTMEQVRRHLFNFFWY